MLMCVAVKRAHRFLMRESSVGVTVGKTLPINKRPVPLTTLQLVST